ncbi:MAG: integrase family protein [Phycisphaerales bacterium]
MSNRFEFTQDAINRRCPLVAKDEGVRRRVYWDNTLRGFGLVVGKTHRSFVAQKDIGGRSVRVTIGRFPEWTSQQARKEARQVLAQMDRGIDPNAEKRERAQAQRRREWQTFTLAQAIDEHVANMEAKDTVERSRDMVRSELERHLGDWLKKPLADIRRKDCIERHRRITTNSGPVAANRALSILRAVYNSARRLYEQLPPHPVEGVTFNKQHRKRSPIAWTDLPEWWAKVEGLDNTVRRDLQFTLLFTGLRSQDARTIRWEHIDFDARTLHRPKPKGGEDRAFTVPLCGHLCSILANRQMDNLRGFSTDQGWVFPTRDRDGRVVHVREPKEQRYDTSGKKIQYLPSPHRLRDTFATACLEAGIGATETKILLNHALPNGDVTEGYQRPSAEHLRGCVDAVAAFLLERVGPGASESGQAASA